MLSTYLSYQVYANNPTRSLQQVAAEPEVASDQKYYQSNIGKVKSVDDFINNYRLFSYAMKASGLEDMTYAKAFMKKVLTSDLSSSRSFTNQLTDPRFKAFAENFSFGTTGTAGATAAAQTSTQENDTVSLYTAKTGGSSINSVLATAYYESHIGSVKNMSDLMNDSQLYSYVMTAYGLDSNAISKGTLAATTNAQNALTSVLESDSSDPNSTANQMASGQVSTSDLPQYAQSSANQDATSGAYTKTYGRTTDLIYYENTIGSVNSVDSFLADPTLVSVAEKAYGIDSANYSTSDLKKILTSDLSNPMSVANQLGPGATAFAKAFNFTSSSSATNPFAQMARDFNFDSTGAVVPQRQAESRTNMAATETLYTQQAGTSATSKANASTETSYYTSAMTSVTSIDDLLGNSRLVSYIKSAYGIDSKTSTDTLRQVLTSDLTNKNSVADRMGTAYRQLAAAFNFSTSGTITRDTSGSPETAKNALMLGDGYLEQSLEDNAGQSNEGVKLALYFKRKGPSITNAYQILADSALLKVVQTALNIPASSSSQDIATQATQITNRLNLSDLRNPTKLSKFIVQFTNLYDLQNSSSNSASNTITALFG